MRAPTKTVLIHDLLRRRILALRHRPGEYLNVDELARAHAVSPIPVREAVARLAAERLVILRPHVGAEVAPVDGTSVREIFALLTGLELAAAAESVARVTPADLARLRALHRELAAHGRVGDRAEWDRRNAAFHLALASLAALPAVVEQLRVAFEHWDRARRHLFERSPEIDFARAQQEHRAMIAALQARDAGRLRRLLLAHNARARDRFLRLLGEPKGEAGGEGGGRPGLSTAS